MVYRSPSAMRSRGPAKRLHRYIRRLIAEGAPCAWCLEPIDLGLVGDHPYAPSADHIVDRADGGRDKGDNVQPMHVRCNQQKNKAKVRGASMSQDLVPTDPIETVDAELITEEEDFWDLAPAVDTYGVDLPGKVKGRYIYPDPPGYERAKGATTGFMRMTNLASAFSDQIRLQLWRERQILLGLRSDEGTLFDELCAEPLEYKTPQEIRKYLEWMAKRASEQAGSDRGARRGTARHLMLQTNLETGTIVGNRRMKLQLSSLFEALERHRLEFIPGWSERRVCNPDYHVIGTLDGRVRDMDTGEEGVLDLKTQRSFWSYLEIAGQQFGYDDAEWTWEGPNTSEGRWVRSPANTLTGLMPENKGKRVALLAHMPQADGPGQLPVEIHEVSLEFGRDVLDLALRNVQLRSRGSSTAKGKRIGGVRPLRAGL